MKYLVLVLLAALLLWVVSIARPDRRKSPYDRGGDSGGDSGGSSHCYSNGGCGGGDNGGGGD